MQRTAKTKQIPLFITVSDSAEYCKTTLGWEAASYERIQSLVTAGLLPAFKSGDQEFILESDLESLLPALSLDLSSNRADLFGDSMTWDGVLSEDTRIDLPSEATVNPAFYAAVRNLIASYDPTKENKLAPLSNVPYFAPARISTRSDEIRCHVETQTERSDLVDMSDSSDFARSAYYMGSKRNLTGFLVEAISSVLGSDGVVVDLMCGSGAASRAFNKLWRTVASDNQIFCRILATVQGGGFTSRRAENLLSKVIPLARSHALDLGSKFEKALEHEDKVFHGDLDLRLLEEYRNYVRGFPTYPDEALTHWSPTEEVNMRKQNRTLYPYCLFSAYFANVYFGLRQCVEIDSLRFAIDQLKGEYEREWALGALITTLSALGTTYAAHFAQPKVSVEGLNLLNLHEILEQRSYSISHEFSVRLMNLAEESQATSRQIESIAGPWQQALVSLDRLLMGEQVVVYLDAPYKREEYSRYYHILETSVIYSYPDSIGKARMPPKGTIERPESEFSTRVEGLINEAFVRIICEVLNRGWSCAWSYADSGDADIVKVLRKVTKNFPCRIVSYATPYQHKAQGKGIVGRDASKGKVTEYVIILTPADKS